MSEALEPKKNLKKSGLGRGLGSLLGGGALHSETSPKGDFGMNEQKAADSQNEKKTNIESKPIQVETAKEVPRVPDHARIWNISITKLKGNKKQPRQVFGAEALKELSSSIKEKGILQPIVARPLMDGNFEIIAGERRWRAAQAAGLHEVPVILKSTPDQEALELALIENIQRENLNPIEEAEAYSHLIQTYSLTQQELADRMGKDRATVANILRLLGLVKPVRDMLSQSLISMGHAKVLLAVTAPIEQKKLADKVVQKKLSVRELEREVANLLKPKSQSVEPVSEAVNLSERLVQSLCQEFQKTIGTKVNIDYDKGRGRFEIHFYSDAELNGIVEKLRSAWVK